MKLGLTKDEVILVPHDKAWKNAFMKAKKEIMASTYLSAAQIEHIGSTSIEGIHAKPVIDILIGVEKLEFLNKTFFKDLQKAGFYRLRVVRPNEIVCARFLDKSFETKTHFIHIVDLHQGKWHQMLFFRDYLITHPEAKKQYENLKQSFFDTNLQGVNDYTDYKEAFIQSIFAKMTEEESC